MWQIGATCVIQARRPTVALLLGGLGVLAMAVPLQALAPTAPPTPSQVQGIVPTTPPTPNVSPEAKPPAPLAAPLLTTPSVLPPARIQTMALEDTGTDTPPVLILSTEGNPGTLIPVPGQTAWLLPNARWEGPASPPYLLDTQGRVTARLETLPGQEQLRLWLDGPEASRVQVQIQPHGKFNARHWRAHEASTTSPSKQASTALTLSALSSPSAAMRSITPPTGKIVQLPPILPSGQASPGLTVTSPDPGWWPFGDVPSREIAPSQAPQAPVTRFANQGLRSPLPAVAKSPEAPALPQVPTAPADATPTAAEATPPPEVRFPQPIALPAASNASPRWFWQSLQLFLGLICLLAGLACLWLGNLLFSRPLCWLGRHAWRGLRHTGAHIRPVIRQGVASFYQARQYMSQWTQTVWAQLHPACETFVKPVAAAWEAFQNFSQQTQSPEAWRFSKQPTTLRQQLAAASQQDPLPPLENAPSLDASGEPSPLPYPDASPDPRQRFVQKMQAMARAQDPLGQEARAGAALQSAWQRAHQVAYTLKRYGGQPVQDNPATPLSKPLPPHGPASRLPSGSQASQPAGGGRHRSGTQIPSRALADGLWHGPPPGAGLETPPNRSHFRVA